MQKILSISVAAYNAEKWIERCLDSFIIPEVIDEIEILIVNDGSTDRTSAIAKVYTLQYPSTFKLIDKENGGHGSTINAAIKAASGKYFKIVDSDDWVEKNELIILIQQLKEMVVDLVISPYYLVNADTFSKQLVMCIDGLDSKNFNKILTIDRLNVKWNLAMHGITFYTKILKNNFTLIDENCFYVDLEYMVFYITFAKTVFISDVPIYDYLIGTNEQSVNIDNMVKRRNQHLRVCKTIVNYYSNCSYNINIIRDIVEKCVINQYRILLQIPETSISKTELLQFETTLKNTSSVIYNCAISNGIRLKKETAILIWLLRKMRFSGYSLIHYLLRYI